jgi:uncharacterized membrane protein YcaP (DUF421 family)
MLFYTYSNYFINVIYVILIFILIFILISCLTAMSAVVSILLNYKSLINFAKVFIHGVHYDLNNYSNT